MTDGHLFWITSRAGGIPALLVPVTPLMARFAAAVAYASVLTTGLVDGTLLGELETAGYRTDLGVPLDLAGCAAPRSLPRPS